MRPTEAALLEQHGIKPSAQRVAIASYVLHTDEHPSADEVWTRVSKTFPMVSRATVYNTLKLFVERGLLRQLVLTEGRLVFDANTDKHHHIIDEGSRDGGARRPDRGLRHPRLSGAASRQQGGHMKTIGDKLPEFSLQASVSTEPGKEFEEITNQSYPGKWQVIFFWPMDFTFVCPTEIAEFGRKKPEFAKRDAQVLGASTDTHYVHLAWRNDHPDLRELPFPMLADTKRELASELGILHKDAGVCLRATYIVDPEGVIRFVSVNDLSVGRNVDEVLRVLDALQTGELTACGWTAGEPTLDAA
jgi:peroxiredoxin (alkyl hydroperoxide reductase subunit C)